MTAQVIPFPARQAPAEPTAEDAFVLACLNDPRLRRFTEPQIRHMFKGLELVARRATPGC